MGSSYQTSALPVPVEDLSSTQTNHPICCLQDTLSPLCWPSSSPACLWTRLRGWGYVLVDIQLVAAVVRIVVAPSVPLVAGLESFCVTWWSLTWEDLVWEPLMYSVLSTQILTHSLTRSHSLPHLSQSGIQSEGQKEIPLFLTTTCNLPFPNNPNPRWTLLARAAEMLSWRSSFYHQDGLVRRFLSKFLSVRILFNIVTRWCEWNTLLFSTKHVWRKRK